MSTADNNWWLIEAGEYVLGTLSGSERELFEKVLERDSDARMHVKFWEDNFLAVEQLIQQKEASTDASTDIPEYVWDNILVAIKNQNGTVQNDTRVTRTVQRDRAVRNPTVYETVRTSNDPKSDIVTVRRSLRRSRWLTGLSMAATLVMGAFLLTQTMVDKADTAAPVATVDDSANDTIDYNVIAVLRDESGTDLWAILAETESGRIRSVALQAPNPTEQNSHQLWVVLPDDAGVQPVGLLPYGTGNAQVYELDDATQQARLNSGAAFAVSLEPAGGTTEAAPTGAVISVGEYTRINSSND